MLPSNRRRNEIEVRQNEQGSALQLRENAVNSPAVLSQLNEIETGILKASTGISIREIQDTELVPKVKTLITYIAKDVGITREIEDYQKVRVYDILRRYYSEFSLSDIKLAFELALIGELDEHLPKSDGRADKGHYQNFSIEYVTKILNAFKRKREETIYKAVKALPEPKKEFSERDKMIAHNSITMDVINAYIKYKYTDILDKDINEHLFMLTLKEAGFEPVYEITHEDKLQAMRYMLARAAKGLITPFQAECIRYQKTEHPDIENQAKMITRRKAIANCFDLMRKYEIQITEHLKLYEIK